MESNQPEVDYGSDAEFFMTGLESEMIDFPNPLDIDNTSILSTHYTVMLQEYKRLWTENSQLRVGWADDRIKFVSQIQMMDLHLEQRQRLLEKQTGLVEILSDSKKLKDKDGIEGLQEYTSACDRCAYHRDMWRRLRAMNLEQQKRCEVESANVRSIQHQQGKQLAQTKNRYLRLQTLYDELKRRKDDPLCRDSEVCKLRQELVDAKAMTAAYNQTALKANNEARLYSVQLEEMKQKGVVLQAEINVLKSEVRLSGERVEVLMQTASTQSMEAIRLFTLGECKDLVCRNRQLGCSHKMNMALQEIAALNDEIKNLQEDLTRTRADNIRWRKQYDNHTVKRDVAVPLADVPVGSIVSVVSPGNESSEPQLVMVQQQVVQVIEQKSKPLVANLGHADELTMRLQSLFELVPGWDAEMDENEMYDEFILDQEQQKREMIIEQMYSACHNGNPLPEKERKKIHDTSLKHNRACKRSFSACLRAIGGIMVKKRSRNIWLNFRQTRAPIFKWCVQRR